ncbi:hypothetical protein TSUD_404980 [Trifolium subterraneum]|uniref:Uncharacterized protein n=1 Tax=Trifolium subterraneum TaxID=3900 RepID=A0A2Z6NVI4_TRISU|nr:hypothetical protein TSUD_404980 [Trifolium subterraneum]
MRCLAIGEITIGLGDVCHAIDGIPKRANEMSCHRRNHNRLRRRLSRHRWDTKTFHSNLTTFSAFQLRITTKAVQVSGEGGENRVVIDPVALGEFVTTVNEQEPHYFYMYTHVLQTLHLWLPFNFFECQILRVMNVAPCQLHPNNWAFLKAFQVACEGLDLVPTAGVFFCFFHVKNVSPHFLISISSQPNKGCFSLYASNFKNYEDTFVRFRCVEGFPTLMFYASGNRLFPFYWSSSPCLIKGTRPSTLNEYERLAVSALSKFQVLSSVELIFREDKPQSLGEYMSSMSTISAQQRAALVMKARAQKAEAECAAASADAMSQLVVEESGVKSTKRKNLEGSGRIPVEIKKMKVTMVGEEEGDDEPLKPRRSKGRGLTSLGSSEGGSNAATKGKGASIPCCPFNPGEKEFAAAKSKFEEDLAAVKAEQEEKVKAAVKAKEDEVVALKGKLVTVEGKLAEEKAKVKTQQEEASLNAEALTGRIETLKVEGESQFDEGFKFALEQVKVAFPDVDAVKLGELDSVNQIVEGKIVPYVAPPSE